MSMGRASVTISAVLLVTAAVAGGAFLYARQDEPPAEAATTASPEARPGSTARAFAIEDPAGDASEYSAGAVNALRCVTYFVTGMCLPSPVDGNAVGTRAPHLDIVSTAVEAETPTDVVVTIQVAELQEGLPQLADPEGLHRAAWYYACWTPGDDDHWRCAGLTAMVHDGEAHFETAFDIYSEQCNEWWWCTWTIPYEVEYGAPATIRLMVPKALNEFDAQPLEIREFGASSGWYGHPEAFPMWHGGATAHTPAYHFHEHPAGIAAGTLSDFTDVADMEGAFAPSTMPGLRSPETPLMVGAPGNMHGGGSIYDKPELDILAADLHEDGDDLVVTFTVGTFEETPEYDFDYSLAVAWGAEVWEVGYRHSSDGYHGYAGHCVMENCEHPTLIETDVEITNGSPGTIAVRVPLEFVGSPAPGTATTMMWTASMFSDVNYYWGEPGGDMYGDYHSVFMVDALFGGAPYVFGSGHHAAPLAPAAHQH